MSKPHPQRRAAIEAYQAGKPSGEVCQDYGVSYASLNKWLKAEGIPRRGFQPLSYKPVSRRKANASPSDGKPGRRRLAVDEASVIAQYDLGYSASVLAKHYRIDIHTILRILKNGGRAARGSRYRTPKHLPPLGCPSSEGGDEAQRAKSPLRP